VSRKSATASGPRPQTICFDFRDGDGRVVITDRNDDAIMLTQVDAVSVAQAILDFYEVKAP
jgi:hypothetical protein